MPEFKTVTDVIPAGETRTYSCFAHCVRVIYASASFTISTDDGSPGWIDAGMALRSEKPVARIRVTAGAVALTFRLALYEGAIDDNRVSGSVSSKSFRPDMLAGAAPVTVVGGAAAVVLIAARAEREEAFITNLGPAALILGAAPAAALGSHYLAAGETYVVRTSAEIKAYAVAGSNAVVWTGESYYSV